MANITDQFVTSFSELYYSKSPIVGTLTNGKYAEADIKTWFDFRGTEKAVTVTVGAVAADDVLTVTLDGTVFTSTATATTPVPATEATALALIINGDSRFTAVAASEVITITGGVGVMDYSVTVISSGSRVDVLTLSTTVPFVNGTELIPLVMEIGTLSNEATVIDTPTFGEVYRGKLRGQLDGGQLDSQLYWAPRNDVHRDLRDLSENGEKIYVGIKWRNNSEASADVEYVYFDSFVSSFGIDTTFDDVAKVSCTFVVDGAEHFAGDL